MGGSTPHFLPPLLPAPLCTRSTIDESASQEAAGRGAHRSPRGARAAPWLGRQGRKESGVGRGGAARGSPLRLARVRSALPSCAEVNCTAAAAAAGEGPFACASA